MATNKVKALELAILDSSTLTGGWDAINSGGLDEACIILKLVNASDKFIFISYDGSTANDYLGAGATLELNLQSNNAPNSFVSQFGKGVTVYAKGVPGTGYLYLSGYYL